RRSYEQVNPMTEVISNVSREPGVGLQRGTDAERVRALLEAQTRRHFLRSATGGLGAIFLGTLGSPLAVLAQEASTDGRIEIKHDPKAPQGGLPPQFAPRAKRVIYLHMAGAPNPPEPFAAKPHTTPIADQGRPPARPPAS